jgi:hypothetical protein
MLIAELRADIAATPSGDMRGVRRRFAERNIPTDGTSGAPRKYEYLMDEVRALTARGASDERAARVVAGRIGGDNSANIARSLLRYLQD